MKFSWNKKIILAVLLTAVLISLFGNAADVQAQEKNTSADITSDSSVTLFIIVRVAAAALSFTAYLLDFAISLGNKVMSLDAVIIGWQIILGFTNLGFVLAIIVIAFATILRIERYGMKQILWKLVVAALLVNFSLVIAGAIISVSNVATNTFLQATTTENLSNALANALQPQRLGQVEPSFVDQVKGLLDYAVSFMSPGAWINFLIRLLFILVFTFLMVLSFLTLFVMLLVRVFALIFLLILSPIVWLLWIFPSTQKYWQKWWQEFIRWNFFAPAVMFFVYLTVKTASLMQHKEGNIYSIISSKSWLGGVTNFFIDENVFKNTMESIVLLALLSGGIYVANKFGIAGGGIGVSLAGKAGKGAGAWAERKGTRAGTWAFRTEKGRKMVEDIQSGKGVVGRIPFVGKRIGHVLSQAGAIRGESLIKQAEERYRGTSDKQLALRMSTMSADERTMALSRLAKNKNLDMIPEGAAKYIKDSKTQKIFESYGQKKSYNDLEKTAGVNTSILNAADKNERGKRIKEFIRSYSGPDYDKLQKDILGKKTAYGLNQSEQDEINELTRNAIFDNHPGAISKIRAKLDGDDLTNFQEKLDEYIDKFENNIGLPSDKRGSEISIELKMEWINEPGNAVSSYLKDWSSRIYNVRKNFAGSLLGGGFVGAGGVGSQQTP